MKKSTKVIKVIDFMKKLNELPFVLQGRDDSHFYAHIENILRDLPDVGVQNWTPVEEGFPQKAGWYWVTVPGENGYEVERVLYRFNYRGIGEFSTFKRIVAFMPSETPQPYKEIK